MSDETKKNYSIDTVTLQGVVNYISQSPSPSMPIGVAMGLLTKLHGLMKKDSPTHRISGEVLHEIANYITQNPSPSIPVAVAVQIIGKLQQLPELGASPNVSKASQALLGRVGKPNAKKKTQRR